MKSNSLVCWSAQYSLLHLLPGFAPEKNSLRRKQNSKEKYHKQISFQKLPEKSNLHLLRPAGVRSWVVVLLRGLGLALSVARRYPPLHKVPPGARLDLLTCGEINQKSLSHLCLALLIEELRSSSFLKSCRLEQTVFWEFAQKRSILRKKYFPFLLNSCSS